MLNNILNLLVVALQNYVIVKFLVIIFNSSKLSMYDISLIMILSIESLTLNSIAPPLLSSILAIITCIIYSYLKFNKSILKIIYSVIICFSILYFINLLILSSLLAFGINYFDFSFYQSCIITLISIYVFSIIQLPFSHIKRYGSNFNTKIWFTLTLVPFLSIIIIHITYFFSFLHDNYLLLLAMMAIVLSLNIIVFKLFIDFSNSKDLVKQNEIKKTATTYQQIILDDIQKTYENTLKLHHDFNNHISIIKELIIQSNGDSFDYLEKLEANLPNINIVNTKNIILNTIISQKLISFDGEFIFSCFGDAIYIDDYDLVTIFSNLLDNAIEAQKNINQKFISININDYGDEIIICIKNKYEHSLLKYKKSRFISSKSDTRLHGLGINNVLETIEKYHGTVDIYFDKFLFKVTCHIKKIIQ